MAVITITIPDAYISRGLDAIAATYNYNAATDGTKAAFAKKQVGIWFKSVLADYEVGVAARAAAATVRTEIQTNVVIT